ncbi:MAG: hypothetical protein Unbinned1966contig1000_39 [Prokaryotic dsDNA virus sp.]|nr:MAG: hypothetical protein Unbinned1966contig1000_39 [Prokaryotic dsDNA virus sp.]|tara:strand:+ start:6710 stop:7861 length:1152 start_codon:yes stop_codon:yes gene_type:complete
MPGLLDVLMQAGTTEARRRLSEASTAVASGLGMANMVIGRHPDEFPETELTFGGSYPVYSSDNDFKSIYSIDIDNIAYNILVDHNKLEKNPKKLNQVKTNDFYYFIKGMKDNKVHMREIKRQVEIKLAKDMYGTSVANFDEASPYAAEIVNSYLERAGVQSIYESPYGDGKAHFTLMPGEDGPEGRSGSVCADTACAVYTGAGLINYLPWSKTEDKWSSNNNYIIDAIQKGNKGDPSESWKHWTTVGDGNPSNSFQNAQPGDWVIMGEEGDFAARAGNESGKHSMIVLDVTEKGVLFASGNYTDAHWKGKDAGDHQSGIEHRFYSWEHLNRISGPNSITKVFRFTPQTDNMVQFENQIFSHKGGFDAKAASGALLRDLMYDKR